MITTPLTLIVDIHAKDEHRQLVKSRLVNLAIETAKEAGNICYIVHEVDAEPGHFIIYEKWQGKAALDFHMQQDYLIAFLQEEETLLKQKIAGKFCSELIAE